MDTRSTPARRPATASATSERTADAARDEGPAAGDEPRLKPARFAALHSRNFRLLWFGLLASNVGTWMAQTAEGWLVTDLRPDRAAFVLGLIAVSFAIPMLLLPPLGGAIADRVPRLRLLWAAQFLYVGLSAALALLTLTGLVEVWMLMAYAFLNGAVLAFDNPTRHALLPDLVSTSQLTSAVSLNAAVFTGAALVGPALAGVLIPLIGVGGIFALNTVSYLSVMWALSRIRGVPEVRERGPRVAVHRTIGAGLGYIWRDPLVSLLLLLALIAGLFGRSFGPLLPVFARDVFHVGSVAFGLMVAAPGLGTLVGSIGLAAGGHVHGKGRWILLATLAFSGLLLAFALSPWYALALPLLVLVGLASAIGTALIATQIQLAVPRELRGRVMSFYTLTLIGVPSLGALLAGTVAEIAGPRVAVGVGAALVGVLTLVTYARNPHLLKAEAE